MAPPIPGLRQPVKVPHRTAGDVLLGIVAVVALAALTIGVPIALVTVVGLPLPHSGPKLSAFTSQLDITSILRILSVVIWLAWIQLVWCVLVELKAAVGHAQSRHVPLAGATQSAVHRLVATALLLFSAAAAFSPVISHGPPGPGHSVSAQASPGGAQSTQASLDVRPVNVQAAPNSDKVYVVKPPVGRFHESLWEIAQKHLGDGRRYREVYELNSDRVQPDGSKLTIASLIRPGWILLMPKDAHGPGIQALTPRLADEMGMTTHPAAPSGGGGTGRSGSSGSSGIWADRDPEPGRLRWRRDLCRARRTGPAGAGLAL
jgi:hypothetical protein